MNNSHMALTAKQIKFIASYQLTQSSTESAINAGYSVKTAPQAGCRMLKNPKIVSELEQWKVKKRLDISKDDYISKAMGVFEGGEFVEEPSRVRGLELAGKALGYVGSSDQKQIASTTNNVQINITGTVDQSQLWQATRKLISDD